MRNLIIANFFLMREFRYFGEQIKVVRAATPIVIAFFIGVLLQTLFDAGTFVTLLCWIPFAIAIFLGFFYYRFYPLKYDELTDWQQQWQYLNKPLKIGTKDDTFPAGKYLISEHKRLLTIFEKHFEGDNVDIIKGEAPFLITLLGAALYIWLY
jgi:hypothetical protein